MYLSFRRGFLFIHIPKTAGTALTLALEERALRDDIIVGDTPKARARKATTSFVLHRAPMEAFHAC